MYAQHIGVVAADALRRVQMSVSGLIKGLVDYARRNLELDELDMTYKTNEVLDILGWPTFDENEETYYVNDINEALAKFTDECVDEGIFAREDAAAVCDKVMGCLSLLPSEIKQRMHMRMCGRPSEEDRMGRMHWFYDYCVKNTYVKKAVLDKNPRFESHGLVVTINLAKPEFRDPKKAASGNSVKGGYPKCVICRENVGYVPRSKCTLRVDPIDLAHGSYFWQFSPYGYFHEHGICVNQKHVPMHVDHDTIENLMYFVELFPGYFIGSNAALPRIGGSVLAHDHYQGGGEILPLFNAPIRTQMKFADYHSVEIGTLDWPGTCIRLKGTDKEKIVDLADRIRRHWNEYTNEKLGIIADDADGHHNAISPTVVYRDGKFEVNIILRCNITSAQYPDGVFHAHPEFHVIKKESIGLIEAQGLFILPGRLVKQLADVERCILDGKLSEEYAEFQKVYDETKALVKEFTPEGVHAAMQDELGSICYRILQNTAVFKDERQTIEFLKEIGFEEK